MPSVPPTRPLLALGSWPEAQRLARLLRNETVGGVLLLAAAATALIWANSPAGGSYFALRDRTVGPASLHLDLTLGQWAADGLLAVFFFVAGLELKREFVAGDLRDPRRAAVPIAAAVGGMVLPAVLFVLVNLSAQPGALRGWAIPTATDIAFSLAVLAVVSTHLPSALRTFLLTLAIVDDLLAITVIAIFYSGDLHLSWLAAAVIPIAAFTVLVQRRITAPWLLWPLAILAWGLVHASGIHATVAGVLLGFAVPVRARRRSGQLEDGLAERFEHRFRPLSAGFAVPVFAFFASGVAVGGVDELLSSLGDSVARGIVIALVVGKSAGILLGVWLVARFTQASLAEGLRWLDVVGLALLGGMGFTVSLLIGELAFVDDVARAADAKIGVLIGSFVAALLAAVVLRLRNRTYRLMHEQEELDSDDDGVPDAYEQR